jgi:hypothetical protein
MEKSPRQFQAAGLFGISPVIPHKALLKFLQFRESKEKDFCAISCGFSKILSASILRFSIGLILELDRKQLLR